jgi:energy-coupling factor transporter ATP-binding protein EcfA2
MVSGNVSIGDESFGGISREILFPRVGLVLQDPSVQISGVRDTVFEEVLFTLENVGAVGDDSDSRIQLILRQLGIEHLAHRKPTSLSGGETQRVALATILVARPEVLLLDEPISALDATAQARLRSILLHLRGTTTVLVTDTQIDFPLSVCDRILALDHGRAVVFAEPQQLLSNDQSLPMIGGWQRWRDIARELEGRSDSSHRDTTRILKAIHLA